MVNTSDTKYKSKIWFWQESINKTNLNIEEERDNIVKLDLDLEKPRIKQVVSPDISKTEIK